MNWTEKYRPQTVMDIKGQNKFVQDAESWKMNNEMPNIMIYGIPGNGKTSAAHAIGNDFLGVSKSMNFIEINASQDRRIETIRTTITNFANHKGTDNVPFKICFLDEIDGMTKDSQRALKRTMERAHNVRFIITCNEPHAVDYAIRSRCANYFFERLHDKEILFHLNDILGREGIVLDEGKDNLEMFVSSVNGDMRRAINELQASVYSSNPLSKVTSLTTDKYEKIITSLLGHGITVAHDLLMKEILSGRSVKEICNNLHHCVLNITDIEPKVKFMSLSLIGDMEWRSKSMTPKIIVSWFVAQFIDL